MHLNTVFYKPNIWISHAAKLRDADGNITGEVIKVYVSEKVDQDSLPEEDRIPDCVDGVPVQIIVGPSPGPDWSDYRCRAKSADHIHGVRLRYDHLFWRQPNVHGVGEGIFEDDEGNTIPIVGIKVHVSEKVDQETLPPEDRIPNCLEGVPVQIIERTCCPSARNIE